MWGGRKWSLSSLTWSTSCQLEAGDLEGVGELFGCVFLFFLRLENARRNLKAMVWDSDRILEEVRHHSIGTGSWKSETAARGLWPSTRLQKWDGRLKDCRFWKWDDLTCS